MTVTLDLDAALASLRAALDSADGVLLPADVAAIAPRVAHAGARAANLGETVLAALIGGTGSGKSSLLNALAGTPVTRSGVLRPTTQKPLAWVPSPTEPALLRLLDDLGVFDRAPQQQLPGLAVIDLPDFDSVAAANREVVDRLAPRVDALIWVLDPEKYNDDALHSGYVAPLVAYQSQFLFVLNQVDRLSAADVVKVVADLGVTLRRAGIDRPKILTVAAAPADGSAPRGIDELRTVLEQRLQDKAVAREKVRLDVVTSSRDLLLLATGREHVGQDEATVITAPSFAPVREEVADLIAGGVVSDHDIIAAQKAGARAAAAASSGPLGRALHAARGTTLGKILGLPGDLPVAGTLLPSSSGTGGGLGAAARLHVHVQDVAEAAPAPVAREVRALTSGTWLDDRVRDVESIGLAEQSAPEGVEIPRWWHLMAVLRTLLSAAVVAGLIGLWLTPSLPRPGTAVPWPWLAIIFGLGLSLLIGQATRASGARLGRGVALDHRAALASLFSRELDRLVGAPLHTVGDRWRTMVRHAEAALRAAGA